MKKLLTLMLIGSFFAVVSCGPRTAEQQQEPAQPEIEQPQMEETPYEADTVEVEPDTTVVE